MPKVIIREQGTIVERGTGESQWIIGSGTMQPIYLKANQPSFQPYIMFDPATQSWYAAATLEDDISFKAGTLPAINAGGGGGGGGTGIFTFIDIAGAGGDSSFDSPTLLLLDAPNNDPWALVMRVDSAGPTCDVGLFNQVSEGGGYFAVGAGNGDGSYAVPFTVGYALTQVTNLFMIEGGLYIPSGASEGYVLTCDDSGNATWQAPSGGGGGGTPGGVAYSIQYSAEGFAGDQYFLYNGSQATFNLVDNWGGLQILGRSGGEASIALSPDSVSGGAAGQWILATNGSSLVNPSDFAIYNSPVGIALTIQQATNNVGVGTNNPTSLFTINQLADTTPGVGNPGLYGFALNNQGNQVFSIGNDTGTSASYIQTWNGQCLVLNAQGNPIGIGTNTPAYTLDVNGNVGVSGYINTPRLTNNGGDLTIDSDSGVINLDGSLLTNCNGLSIPAGATLGYVLTSDSSGNASWQAPSASSGPWQQAGAGQPITQVDPSAVVEFSQVIYANAGIALGDGSSRQVLWICGDGDYNHALFNNTTQLSGYDYSALPGNSFGNNDGEVLTYNSFLAFQNRSGASVLSYFDTAGDLYLGGALQVYSKGTLDTTGVNNFVGSGPNDITFQTFPYNGGVPAVFTLTCISTSPSGDVFSLTDDAGLGVGSPISPSPGGNNIGIGYGIQVSISSGVGHTVGDYWTITFADSAPSTLFEVDTSGNLILGAFTANQAGAVAAESVTAVGSLGLYCGQGYIAINGTVQIQGDYTIASGDGSVSVDTNNRQLLSSATHLSHDWQNRQLYSVDGTTINIDYSSPGSIVVPAVTANGAMNLNSNPINNVLDPSSPQDAATKNYVDTQIGRLSAPQTVTQFFNATDLTIAQTYPGLTLVSASSLTANQAIIWQSIEFKCDLTSDTPYTTSANFFFNYVGNYSGSQLIPAGDTVNNGDIGLLTSGGRVNRRFVYNTTADMDIPPQLDLLLMLDGPATGGTGELEVRLTYQIVNML